MNKRILMMVILTTVLGACSIQSQLAAPDKCQSESNITINHGPRGVLVVPSNFCAEPGQTITVNIVPNRPLDTVSTKPKPDNPDNPGPNNWMNRANSQYTERFALKVPEDIYACPKDMIDDKCKYKYSIEIIGFVILDPMITIRQ